MKKILLLTAAVLFISIGCPTASLHAGENNSKTMKGANDTIKLPEPRHNSETSIEKALLERRSIREYKDEPLTLDEVSQLLWSAQGITESHWGLRTAPSAGALYPLEVYVVAGNVEDLPKGVYKYRPHGHKLVKIKAEDVRNELATAALWQSSVKDGAISIVFSAIYKRTTVKYGNRGIKYVHMEAGHAAQNVYLQSVSLGLGTVTVGAFEDDDVKKVLDMPREEVPLYIMPVGRVTR